MRQAEDLRSELARIDGRGYKAYKDIKGTYRFDSFTLTVDHVQGDPFAAPSRVRVRMPQEVAGFPEDTFKGSGRSREIALRDFLSRRFCAACRRISRGPGGGDGGGDQGFGGRGGGRGPGGGGGRDRGSRGSGKSGLIAMERPGQEILERTSVLVRPEEVEARFVMGLPAFGRRVAGRQAQEMFFRELPEIVAAALVYSSLPSVELYAHLETAEDADFIRARLAPMGLVAFVADGAILPRSSGVDPRPLTHGKVVPFRSPESLRVELDLPNSGRVTGMGIPEGVTLIVGGGYHGKSTLLKALELGVYNHVPGDGRERVVTRELAVKIRAEDGRRIEAVDISPFISNLPFGRDTTAFRSEDASGSTSQAANIVEALEAGTSCLLIDEDTSATNFMIRDHRMQQLVSKDREPITPFIDKVGQLRRELGVSTVLVIGGSGDYFDAADRVICMVEYEPRDVTAEARRIAEDHRAERAGEGGWSFGSLTDRIPLSGSFDPSRGRREVKISPKGLHSIAFGRHSIDLGAVEQLVDSSQTGTIGDAIHHATRFMDGKRTLRQILDGIAAEIAERGLDVIGDRPTGDYAAFRKIELAAAINRLRTLKVRQAREARP